MRTLAIVFLVVAILIFAFMVGANIGLDEAEKEGLVKRGYNE